MNKLPNPNQPLINHLNDELKTLLVKIRSLRQAIVGLGGEITNDELQAIIDESSEVTQVVRKPLIPPEVFTEKMSQVLKIAFALKELGGEAYSNDIGEKLWQTESELFPDALEDITKDNYKRNIVMLCSYLFKEGRIKARKDGNKYMYMLIETN